MKRNTTVRWALAATTLFLLKGAPAAPTALKQPNEPLFAAIRNGEQQSVKNLLARGVSANAPNSDGETPLMYAALYGDSGLVQLLLRHGADPNAKSPAGSTALMWATGDLNKVRALLAAGADVNARSATGRNVLMIASARTGGGPIVKLLLEKGADLNARETAQGIPIIPSGSGGSWAVIDAAKVRDGQALRLLLEHGADVNAKDKTGGTPLIAAALNGNVENARLLIEKGADVNAAIVTSGMTALHLAAWSSSTEIARMLLAKGAKVDPEDMSGSTPFMWAAYSDYAQTDLPALLLNAGADRNHKNKAGETALTWAARRGDTAVVKLLQQAGAVDPFGIAANREAKIQAVAGVAPAADQAAIRDAVERSVARLQQGGPQFVKVSGCASCHNQSLPQVAIGMVRERGWKYDETITQQQYKAVLGMLKPMRLPALEFSDVVPDVPGSIPYLLLGLQADKHPSDILTDTMVIDLAARQLPDGSWRVWAPRPPLEFNSFTATALTIRALDVYGPPARRDEYRKRIERAREWLRMATPRTNEEAVMKMLGLAWAKARREDVLAAGRMVLAAQSEDGGWRQLPGLPVDAYATGQALTALRWAGVSNGSDPAYERGVEYLLRTQEADGTWRVTSRAFPFQPLKESGFPHGKDQWISSAGTSWAAMALMLREEPGQRLALLGNR
jgi:ankyrin repeat protein